MEYNTRALALVRDCLLQAGGRHMTVDDIAARLDREGSHIGKSTVYRNLEKLVKAGEVNRYTGGECACFSLADKSCREHFHLKCHECGKLIHLECEKLDTVATHILSEHGFAVDGGSTVFYGVCGECRK